MDEQEELPSVDDGQRHAQHKGRSIPLFDFEQLFGNEIVVLIRLGSEVYELRRTKAGKLVLNK